MRRTERLFATSAALLLVLAGGPVVADDTPLQRPISEMHGDCDDFGWDLSAELAAWPGQPVAMAGSAAAEGAREAAAWAVPLLVALRPQRDVSFAAPPGRASDGEGFAALLLLEIARDGIVRVSAGAPVWIDLVRDGALIGESGFEMQTQCERIFKSVAFPVSAGERLVLQLSGAKSDALRLMLSYAP